MVIIIMMKESTYISMLYPMVIMITSMHDPPLSYFRNTIEYPCVMGRREMSNKVLVIKLSGIYKAFGQTNAYHMIEEGSNPLLWQERFEEEDIYEGNCIINVQGQALIANIYK